MELVEKFAPSNLHTLQESDFSVLTKEDIQLLASVYPVMQPKLLIAKEGTQNPKSPATYKSLYSLLFSGHKFYIAGTMFGKPKEVIDTDADIKLAQTIQTDDYLAPSEPIITEIDVIPQTVLEQDAFVAVVQKAKRTRKNIKK